MFEGGVFNGGQTAGKRGESASNEVLAVHAKAGNTAAAAQLWEQNKGLLYTLCRQYVTRYAWRAAAAGVTWEDIEQEWYFIICEAAQRYEPAKGVLFITLLPYIVQKHMAEVFGIRTKRAQNDPLSKAASLDEPIDAEDETGATRADLVPDPAAAAAFEKAEQDIFIKKLHDDLECALAKLEPKQAAALRGRYYMGYTFRELAESMGCNPSMARTLEVAGLSAIRRKAKFLQPYLDEIRTSRAYRGTGFSAWAYGGSVEERIAEYLERECQCFAHGAAGQLAGMLKDGRKGTAK